MSGKYTPGPWRVAYLDNAGQRVVKAEHIEICTCWHHSVLPIEQEMEANARLIAAAPELLKALKTLAAAAEASDLREQLSVGFAITRAARAAIALAEKE